MRPDAVNMRSCVNLFRHPPDIAGILPKLIQDGPGGYAKPPDMTGYCRIPLPDRHFNTMFICPEGKSMITLP